MPEELAYIIKIAGLILKHHRDELTEDEALELRVWCAQSRQNQGIFDRLSHSDFIRSGIRELPDIQLLKKEGWDRIMTIMGETMEEPLPMSVRSKGWVRYAVAVSIAGILGLGGWLYWRVHAKSGAIEPSVSHIRNDVAPGRNRAVLTLSDGSKVDLDSAVSGRIAAQAGSEVTREIGSLKYMPVHAKAGTGEAAVYNMLTTPPAGQYRVILPDGSKVWLNNASSLRYPVAFTGRQRVVELDGEAFFEIARNADQPFVVKVAGMSVDVLGTSFNISAYYNDPQLKTTLLTGGVELVRGAEKRVLKPGEQVLAGQRGAMEVRTDVDTEGVIAWKNGLFHFDHSDLQTVMQVLARWYDIEVVYEGEVPTRVFGGDIEKNLSLKQVLEVLEKSHHLHFDLAGKRLTVRP